MAKDVFDPNKIYLTRIWGHGFTHFPEIAEPRLKGTFEAETVECYDKFGKKHEFAVFTVLEPENAEFPHQWVGTYRIPIAFVLGRGTLEEVGTISNN